MPSLTKITANFFVGLINRLGVRPPPEEAFLLSNVVQPVSIVDSDIALPAVVTTQLLGSSFSQGLAAAPVAGGVLLADTGPQPLGNFNVLILVGQNNTAGGADFIIERRNAANAANIWRQVFATTTTAPSPFVFSAQVHLELNERIRVITEIGGTGDIEANIFLTQVS
jgi:hypothetical protein